MKLKTRNSPNADGPVRGDPDPRQSGIQRPAEAADPKILCLPIALAATALMLRGQLRPQAENLGPNLPTLAALTLTTGLMQLTSLLTFERLLVGYSLALFQLSSLLSVLLGHHFFQEQHLRRRLLGAGIMSAGATLIIVFPNPTR